MGKGNKEERPVKDSMMKWGQVSTLDIILIGREDGTGPEREKRVPYTEIIPVLIEAIKEQQKTIEEQQEEIEEMKAATRQLKAGMNKSVASLQT